MMSSLKRNVTEFEFSLTHTARNGVKYDAFLAILFLFSHSCFKSAIKKLTEFKWKDQLPRN